MVFVERRNGSISGLYSVAQEGVPVEELPEDNGEVLAFRSNSALTPDPADLAHIATIKANSRRVAIINYLNTHTDTEILAYVSANSNTLAKAQTMLGDIALILAAAVRD